MRTPSVDGKAIVNTVYHYRTAIERLQSAQVAWQKKRIERLDWLNDELRRHQAQAMQAYAMTTGKKLDTLPSEHTLSDFYTPSFWEWLQL